jgi:hypothetical protein
MRAAKESKDPSEIQTRAKKKEVVASRENSGDFHLPLRSFERMTMA